MPTRQEKFDRGDFEQRARLLEARDAEVLAAVRGPAAGDEAADDDEPTPAADAEDQNTTRQHLLSLGYTTAEIDKMFSGPSKG